MNGHDLHTVTAKVVRSANFSLPCLWGWHAKAYTPVTRQINLDQALDMNSRLHGNSMELPVILASFQRSRKSIHICRQLCNNDGDIDSKNR